LWNKINESELDDPEKVPEQPLDENEKLDVVCNFMKKHPQLLLQAIPGSKKSPRNIRIAKLKNKQNSISKSRGSTKFPKAIKTRRSPKKFRTIERDEAPKYLYSGNLRDTNKYKVFRDSSNSPAVPIPSNSRLTSHSNHVKNLDNSLTKDIKMISSGLNFNIEVTGQKPRPTTKKPKVSQKRKLNWDSMKSHLLPKSRATTSEINRRINETKKMREDLEDRIWLNNKLKHINDSKSRPQTHATQKTVKSSAVHSNNAIKSTIISNFIVSSRKPKNNLYTLNSQENYKHTLVTMRQKQQPPKVNWNYMNIRQNRMSSIAQNSESPDRGNKHAKLKSIQRVNRSQVVNPAPFKFHRKSHDISKFNERTQDNSYGYVDTSKDLQEASKDTCDYYPIYDSQIEFKKKKGISEYFNQKQKFIGKDVNKSNKFMSISTHSKRQGGTLNSLHSNPSCRPLVAIQSTHIQGQNKDVNADDTYSRKYFYPLVSENMSVLSKNGEYNSLRKLGAYFSEKDLKPKFTESILKKQNKSQIKNSEEDDLLEMIDHPTMRSNNEHDVDNKKSNNLSSINNKSELQHTKAQLLNENAKEENKQSTLEKSNDQRLTELFRDNYIEKQRRFNDTQTWLNKYPKMDTALHWSKEGQKLPLDENREPIISQKTIEAENEQIRKEEQTKADEVQKVMDAKEQQQREVEEVQEKILKDNTIKNLIVSSGHKNIYKDEDTHQQKKKSSRFSGEGSVMPSHNNETHKPLKIKNIDWFDTEIRKAIENKTFNINEVSLSNFNEIYDNFKWKDIEVNKSIFSADVNTSPEIASTDKIREYLGSILESKSDCLIKYNEIDAMLKLIKDRFHDFKRSPYLEEFFKSASFTLYILTLHLCLPDTHFYRIVNKYDEVSYENTIKLVIRWKIFYEAREILASTIKMISDREYTAALIQTKVASLDDCEEENDDEAISNLQKNMKTLTDQSDYIEEKINKFREVNPFDRVFLYKGDDYTKTMKHYHSMLDKVLQVHEIS